MHIKQMEKDTKQAGIKTLETYMQESTKQKVLSHGKALQHLNSGAQRGKYPNKTREIFIKFLNIRKMKG